MFAGIIHSQFLVLYLLTVRCLLAKRALTEAVFLEQGPPPSHLCITIANKHKQQRQRQTN